MKGNAQNFGLFLHVFVQIIVEGKGNATQRQAKNVNAPGRNVVTRRECQVQPQHSGAIRRCQFRDILPITTSKRKMFFLTYSFNILSHLKHSKFAQSNTLRQILNAQCLPLSTVTSAF